MAGPGYVRRVPQTMVVTGGRGFLGRRVCRLAEAAGWTVVAPASDQLDVRDHEAVFELFRRVGPDATVHLAYRRRERDTIVDGSAAVATAAAAHGTRLVHLSTDVVFGGRDEPYREDDVPDPVEPYGAAKAEAEQRVAAIAPEAVLVRTSLLLGDGDDLGQPELDVIAAATGVRPFTFFIDEIRSPARAADVAAVVLALATSERAISGPLHVAGPEPLDRVELARRIARAHGLELDRLRSGRSADEGLAGLRPGRVVLDVGRAGSAGLSCRPI